MVKERVPLGKISKGKGEEIHQPVFNAGRNFGKTRCKVRLYPLPETKVRIKRKKKLWRP